MDELLAEAQRRIRAGLNGTLDECLENCNRAIEIIQEVRDGKGS